MGKKLNFLLFLLIVAGIFLRFYNLSWGAPYFFHPDERNIINAVIGLHFPNQLNPHFFAYGSFPIYTIYFTGVLVNIVTAFLEKIPLPTITNVSFGTAALISRFYSALLSVGLLLLIY